MDTSHHDLNIKDILERLNALESRILRIETNFHIELPTSEQSSEENPLEQIKKISDGSFIESKFGESGLAWLGNFVLFFGIAFLVQYIQNSGYQLISSAFGYLSVAGIFVVSYFLKKTYPKMTSVFNLNAWLLLFYVTLRLHFFSTTPIVPGKSFGLILVLIVLVILMYLVFKKRSALYGGVVLLLSAITAIVSDSTHIMLPLSIIIAIAAIVFVYRFNWIRIFYFAIILTYLINFLWFMDNPFMGHPLQAITGHDNGYVYIFIVCAIFSLIALFKSSDKLTVNSVAGAIVLNGLGFSFLLLLYVLSFFKDDYVLMISLVSAYCLLYSVLLQLRSEWKITAALFALYGFITMSIAAYGIYDFPKVYFFLAIQSLLVVSMAIWFRSRFIVLMNTFLFITLLIFYAATSSLLNGVNISFTLVAILTARILNWKKEKLTIKTDVLRNIYLAVTFIMVLFTLHHLIPARFVTLSWSIAAVVYFGLSLLLKNIKYRYLALGTMISAVLYLFIIDLAKIELVYRIVALLFLSVVSIGLSVFYTGKSKSRADKK